MLEHMAQEAQGRAETLYGSVPHDEGIVHVAAVVRAADGFRVLEIGKHSPKSDTDAFALSLSRVRSDAILSTGAILRAEPEMQAEPFGRLADSLRALRTTAYGRMEPPALLVLTGGNVDVDHPAFHGWARPYLVTGAAGAARLRPRIAGTRIHLVELEVPSAAATITWAQEHLAARTVVIEAGPSTALPLYGTEHVDELMLSVFEGDPPSEAIGKPFLPEARVEALFGAPKSSVRLQEPSGSWRIERYLRGTVAGAPKSPAR